MKDLRDGDGVECESDDDKLQALVDRTFFTKEQETVTTEDGWGGAEHGRTGKRARATGRHPDRMA